MHALLLATVFQLAAGAPEVVFAPASAVDHVVTMEIRRNSGTIDRDVITRSGDRFRIDRTQAGRLSVVYSNVRTRLSVRTYRDSDRWTRLDISRQRDYPGNQYRIESTGERERLLGQTCTVFQRTSVQPYPRGGPTYRHCLTSNGIELWWRVYYRSGEVMSSGTAIAVERRRVADSEVRPPADLFRWTTWQSNYPSPEETDPNYEVQLTGTGTGGEAHLTVRHLGQTTYRDRLISARRHLTIDTGAVQLGYYTDENGIPDTLVVSGYWPVSPELRRARAPVALNRAAIVLLQECRWFDVRPGMNDAGQHECLTSDGVPLTVHEFGRVRNAAFEATALTRGRVTRADVTPPTSVFDWDY